MSVGIGGRELMFVREQGGCVKSTEGLMSAVARAVPVAKRCLVAMPSDLRCRQVVACTEC